MNCEQAQRQLSLFLYGELSFAEEESFEEHVAACAACHDALEREKRWHGAVHAGQLAVPLELLEECRRDLSRHVAQSPHGWWRRLAAGFDVQWTHWSARVAAATLLVGAGFGVARFTAAPPSGLSLNRDTLEEAAVFDPVAAHVRSIEPTGDNRVAIVVDQTRQQKVVGTLEDARVRQLVLAAMNQSFDPGVRVDSVDLLKTQQSTEVRDALLNTVRRDRNPGVRLKALDGLRPYNTDPETRETLTDVLAHDSDAGVRTEAIDVLIPRDPALFSPQLAGTLQQLVRSERNDYIRMRCRSALSAMNASLDIY